LSHTDKIVFLSRIWSADRISLSHRALPPMTKNEACIETIRCFHSQLENIEFHNRRMLHTQEALFDAHDFRDLRELIQIPDLLPTHVYKCRVTYRRHIESIEWEIYARRQIASLQLVHDETIDYSFKYRQRHDLDRIYSQRKECDDVLIVRNGYLTDTYVCNIALLNDNNWLTPAEPLLKGTQREYLLRKGIISPAYIRAEDLNNFTQIRLFNAMMPWTEAITLPVSRVFG